MIQINPYDIELLKNINENRAWEIFPVFLEHNQDFCACRSCILDVMAITLNTLPPCYHSEEHNLSAARNKVTDEEIYRKMKEAYKIVKSRPRHD
ncbi:MAG: competence protein ComFB [Denitrovibrio sp.]|nr:MAG: competence protein ComFB [Denitrovibrio sp.]